MPEPSRTASEVDPSPERDRAIALFRFLRDLTDLRTRSVRNLSDYERDGRVLWLADVPDEPGCSSLLTQTAALDEDDDWVAIDRPHLSPPPQPPAALERWLVLATLDESSRDAPELREQIRVPVHDGSGSEPRALREQPRVRELFSWYVENRWKPWANEHRKLARVQRVYNDLFTMHQREQRLGEEYEVVLGLGCLSWRSGNATIRRHLVTARASVELEPRNGRITVGPGGDGAHPQLEQDMLEPQGRPHHEVVTAVEGELEQLGDGVWDRSRLGAMLRSWTHALGPEAGYDESTDAATESPKAAAHVALAPALILRRRTDRSLRRCLTGILQQLGEGHPVPFGIERFVTVVEDPGRPECPSTSELPPTPEMAYLPLESNAEQRAALDRLTDQQGVLVQGPPGTGKSHTIANLISHLLATGKRVLVTSHTARALRVLRDKLPPGIKQLCVDLLGANRDALRSLEESVQAITDHHKSWDREASRRRIAELEDELQSARAQDAELASELRALQERDSFRHVLAFGDYRGTLQAIAQRLAAEAEDYAWLRDRADEDRELPLGSAECEELARLCDAIAEFPADDLVRTWPRPAELPDPAAFSQTHDEIADLQQQHDARGDARDHPAYAALAAIEPDEAARWHRGLTTILDGARALAQHVQPWAGEAALRILAEQDRVWRERLETTLRETDELAEHARWADRVRVAGIEGHDRRAVRADADALLHHLENGGGLGFWVFRSAAVKRAMYLVRTTTVDGRPCSEREALGLLVRWLDVHDRLELLRELWSGVVEPPQGVAMQIGHYQDLCEPLQSALALHEEAAALRGLIGNVEGLFEPAWHDLDALAALRSAAAAARVAAELTARRHELRELARQLRSETTPHRVRERLAAALDAGDDAAWRDAYAELEELERRQTAIAHRDELIDRLATDAPEFAAALREGGTDAQVRARVPELRAAWHHARARSFVEKRIDPEAEADARRELERQRERTRAHTARLCEARAWYECLSRLAEHDRQHLVAWTKAVRRIGKGTGKYASRHRRAAREHMAECKGSIPAWIMPMYRVAETVRPGTETFDVVIVDEASQSGPDALFLLYLTKKIVIVGDDKQISPDWVGIEREDVEHLRRRHIAELPHSDAFSLEHSLFDLADIRYGGRIRLREHFRCMPEIIRFSNDLCYRGEPLIPLKQFGAGRIVPVIETRHVPGGYREGTGSHHVVNPPEAEALVSQIVACCADPRYDGKTFGVISLQGRAQAQLIDGMLLARLGPDEILTRQLVCGDAYAFQGDERDVMFLSLVAAVDEHRRIGTLADQRSERRFNVAVSRAKEQLWLFHSATLEDLSPKGLRYKLLEYCLDPKAKSALPEDTLDPDALRAKCRDIDRNRQRPPEPFDSWFELDVYLQITARGYRVCPQFEVAGYFIDLVVDGFDRRLAVECDGDEWHGAERFDDDMARQRQLERCGWTFWRVRGSRYYLDPDAALDELWSVLEEHGIEPAGVEPEVRTAPPAALSTDEHTAAATPRSPAAQPATVAHVAIEPYEVWSVENAPDPRTADPVRIAPHVEAIVATEGPILRERAVRVYAAAAGIGRVTQRVRAPLLAAIDKAVAEDRMLLVTDQNGDAVARTIDQPEVRLRERGPREFDEIPDLELGAMLESIAAQRPELDDESLFRAVLERYELTRLTTRVRARLAVGRETAQAHRENG